MTADQRRGEVPARSRYALTLAALARLSPSPRREVVERIIDRVLAYDTRIYYHPEEIRAAQRSGHG